MTKLVRIRQRKWWCGTIRHQAAKDAEKILRAIIGFMTAIW
ncbi:hypothetical protein [Parageobacillus thermoglucosidasius]|nr:hypothetical protein [Parageobacillus thermoglucosidasius]KYD13383.1 hypothetical protein B4168_3184 [Anoxybacillus flavithermus]MED4905467.1 hypothetical protein [Parageobacillus thermoglucosidasius]MED4913866.1 hypothetical protein [Parageobacillus thermoglucosidasius]MED4943845.1 hypothetical protein [Parageobacillus thermoglucosidasius]MED4983637.1 hypothetical protein [Parageobacillus thermoglucosidasius]